MLQHTENASSLVLIKMLKGNDLDLNLEELSLHYVVFVYAFSLNITSFAPYKAMHLEFDQQILVHFEYFGVFHLM